MTEFATNTTADESNPCLRCGADMRFSPCCKRAAALSPLLEEEREQRTRSWEMLLELWRALAPKSCITSDTLEYVHHGAKQAIADIIRERDEALARIIELEARLAASTGGARRLEDALRYLEWCGSVEGDEPALRTPPTGEDDGPRQEPQPIGKCPGCGSQVYTKEGFCGVCRASKGEGQ